MEIKLLKGLLLLLLLFASFCFLELLREKKPVRSAAKRLYLHTREKEKQRAGRIRRIRLEEGKQEKESFLWRLECMLEQSGAKKYFGGLNAELFLFLELLLFVGGCLLFPLLGFTGISGAALAGGTAILPVLFLYLAWVLQYGKMEEEVLYFMNLLENYSQTTDDILTIFQRTVPYLNEPLKSAVSEAYMEGRTTGQTAQVFYYLHRKIPHEKFGTILRNLEICSRHEANYQEIIRDSRGMLLEYLHGKKERQAMVQNARIEIGMILLCSLLVFYLVNGFLEEPLLYVLQQSLPGKLLLYYCGGIVLCVLWNLFRMTE